jgi:branched-chain amino acid transport system ATP-binding protein
VNEVLLEARSMSAGYGAMPVIRDIDIEVRRGEVVALIGANGAGKTTTLLTLAGELTPQSGTIRFDGEVTTAPMHVRCRRGDLSFVPQERAVIMNMSVADNLRLAGVAPPDAFGYFPQLELIMPRSAGLCSGGEQQMLALAAALGRNARVLLIDELSLGLAPLVVDDLLATVRRAADEQGVGVVLVEQHVRQALRVADRVHMMEHGRIALRGTADDMARRLDQIEAGYLSST